MNINIRHVTVAALAALLTVGGGIAAAMNSDSNHAHATAGHVVRTVGGEIFKPNASVTLTMHFAPGNVTVHTGDTVVFEHGDRSHDPHSVSIVAAAELPCHADPCPACDRVQKAHFPHGQSQPPLPVVNTGNPGFDRPGDSIVWMSGRTSVKVSAPAGTVLHYFCALHPWMQGMITVVK